MPKMGRGITQGTPQPSMPSCCEKCRSTSIHLEQAIDLLGTTGDFANYWKCVICGWIKFVTPGFAYIDKRTSPRPLGKLVQRKQ
ncbi:MAG: hypothetical protein KC590_16860 [Nitrospira sp.]|nr:hypothetical protein [Nitrospira sp.]